MSKRSSAQWSAPSRRGTSRGVQPTLSPSPAATRRQSRTRGTPCRSRSAFPAGSCRLPATCSSAAAISWRATPAASSQHVSGRPTSRLRGSSAATSAGSRCASRIGGARRVRLTLAHTSIHSPHWDEFGPGAAGVGWELGLMGLAVHLERPDDAQIDYKEAFVASPEGRAAHGRQQRGRGAVAAIADPGHGPGPARSGGGAAYRRLLHRRSLLA